jgi:hypothetical protein
VWPRIIDRRITTLPRGLYTNSSLEADEKPAPSCSWTRTSLRCADAPAPEARAVARHASSCGASVVVWCWWCWIPKRLSPRSNEQSPSSPTRQMQGQKRYLDPAGHALSLSFLLSPSPFLPIPLPLPLPPSHPPDNKFKTSCHLGRRARPAPPAQRALGLYLLLVAALNSHPPIGACIHTSDALLTLNLAGVCWERGTSRDLWNISHRFTLDSAI